LRNIHFGIDDPIQVFLAFVLATRTAVYSTEQSGPPLNTFINTLGSLISLAIFNLGLLIRRGYVVLREDRLDRGFP
jgi:hypothetical protein